MTQVCELRLIDRSRPLAVAPAADGIRVDGFGFLLTLFCVQIRIESSASGWWLVAVRGHLTYVNASFHARPSMYFGLGRRWLGFGTGRSMARMLSTKTLYRTRRTIAAWMVLLWMALLSSTTYAHCCHEKIGSGEVGHSATGDHSHQSDSHPTDQGESSAESCPEWLPVVSVSSDAWGATSSSDGPSTLLATAHAIFVVTSLDVAPARFYFAGLPPPRTYLRFCRFLE